MPKILLGLLSLLMILSVQATESFDDDEWQDELQQQSMWQPVSGFIQYGYGDWLNNDDILPLSSSLNELRLRLETAYTQPQFSAQFKTDLLYDHALTTTKLKIREAHFSGNVAALSIKAGRQIVTWGTGDFVFVNDLFAKDWQSFFNGRDQQYLKSPVDALKLSYYTLYNQTALNVDLIWQPQFQSDQYINGARFSLFSPQANAIVVPATIIEVKQPDRRTIAARIYFSSQQSDIAFYASKGFAPTPHQGTNDLLHFPKLSTIGASIITPLLNGLFKFETAHYRYSAPNNSSNQTRILFGYEQKIWSKLNFATQLYLEYDSSVSTSNAASNRQVVTTALSYLSADDRWSSRIFGFYSPNHHDSYVRTSIKYRHDDNLNMVVGANLFNGKPAMFFGQFDLNDNAYLRLTYYF